jgi:hypothetical protein
MSGRLLGAPLESETEVIEFDSPKAFATRAIRGPRLTTRFELDEVEDGTQVTIDVTGDVPGGKFGERLAENFLRRELTVSLQRLQGLGEADAQEPIA